VQTNDYLAAAASYVAALLALFVEHSNAIIQLMGFILLVARLVHEVPRAYYTVRKWFGYERTG
jgi:uncharacterized membrane protein YecN with MAPEG domain